MHYSLIYLLQVHFQYTIQKICLLRCFCILFKIPMKHIVSDQLLSIALAQTILFGNILYLFGLKATLNML